MAWIVGSILFLMLLLTLIFSFPSVQTASAKRGVAYVNDRYGTDIQLDKFRYVFPDNFILKNLYIADEQQDTLIYAERINAGLDAFVSNTAYSSGASIDNLKFYFLKKKGEDEYNLLRFADKFTTGDTVQNNPFGLQIADVEINNGRFYYVDQNCDTCLNFYIHDLNAEVENFDLKGSEVAMTIQSLSLSEQNSFDIQSFRTRMEYMQDHFSFENAEFRTTKSYFKGDVRMEYDHPTELADFVENVKIIGEVYESDLASEEIQFFSSAFPNFRQFQFQGGVEGMINDLYGEDLDVQFGADTRFLGDLNIRNATTPDSLFINASDVKMNSNLADAKYLYGLFSDSALPEMIDPLGSVAVEGEFEGYLEDFRTDVFITTDLGSVQGDLLMQIPPQGMISYDGVVEVNNFDLGRLLSDTSLGRLSTTLKVDGRGLDPVVMNTRLDGRIAAVEYNNYRYKNIDVDGRIANSRFNGNLAIDDPNLQLTFDGSASFGRDTSHYDFVAEIESSDLHALNFSKDSISALTGIAQINLKALNYDRWAGDINVTNLTYENSQNFHFFEDIKLEAQGLESDRRLSISSQLVNAELQGDYTLEGMLQVAKFHLSKFLKSVEQVPAPANQDFNFDININNTRVLTEILLPKLNIEPGSQLRGSYSSEANSFDLDVTSPGFSYGENRLRKLDLDFSGGPERSELAFSVGSYTMPSGTTIDSVVLDNFYYRDTLNYDLSWVLRDSIDSRGTLHGYAIQKDTSTFITGLYPSGFNIGRESFIVRGGNRIMIDTGGFNIQDFVITNDGRSLTVNGNISDNANEILRINLRGFGVDLVNYFIGSSAARFNGELYGDVILTQILGGPKFAADLHVDSLEMNSTLLGTLDINSDWSVENDTIELISSLKLGDLTTFKAEGYYQPDSLGNIAFDVDFERFRLAAFNPLLEGLAENLRGYVTGGAKIRGTTGAPVVTGELSLPSAAFTISFLQTDYNVVDAPVVKLLEDRIAFPDITLRDTRFGTEGILTGDITHQNFDKFNLDLQIDANELLVLNTTARTEDPYYGTAFVSGDIFLRGPIDELHLSADLSSERNTRFYIPISGSTEVQKSDFITFVNPTVPDSVKVETENRLNLDKGISLDFDLDINSNAELGIIIDEDGNEMHATGSGNLRVRINPFSDLEIYGTYTVDDGYYNFVFQEAVQRRFEILRGGNVTWNGDPYNALINLTARYSTRANPSEIVEGYSGGQTLIYVDLLISGDLMNPDINFDIEAPRAAGNVQSVLASRFTEMDARYAQVFALLTLNRFVEDQGFFGQTDAANVGLKFLAGQAETYLNRFTGDFDVTLNYQASAITGAEAGGVNDPANVAPFYQEEVQVGVSKDILDNRLSINGAVGVPVGQNNVQAQPTIDAEVEYSITPDGRFRTKAFTRPVQQYSFGQQYYEHGVGFVYRVDFETWGDFFSSFLKSNSGKATREEEEEEESNEEVESELLDNPAEPALPENDLPQGD